MKQRLLAVLIAIALYFPSYTKAQENWNISNFHSEIVINQDTSISVKETIDVNFGSLQKHGIFRDIPYLYTNSGRSLKTEIYDISVVDSTGRPYEVSQERHMQSLQLRIGDPDTYVTGTQTYIVSYTVDDAIRIYDGRPEFYWNVTGSEWEVPILNSSAQVTSEFAGISDARCFAGAVGTTATCGTENDDRSVSFVSDTVVGNNSDFTIVVGLSPENNLIFPGLAEQLKDNILENLGYLVAPLPAVLMFIIWWKKGRDDSYQHETYFYKPYDKTKTSAPLFPRKSLPMTYSPINNLSPSEAGTLIDERVHIPDVVAEIVELGRLGYLKIHKVGEKKLFKQQEFSFEKLKDADDKLEPHQVLILNEIFKSKKDKEVKLSKLANRFYSSLPKIRTAIYNQLINKELIVTNPDSSKTTWTVIYIFMNIVAGLITFSTSVMYFNFYPILVMVLLFPIGIIFALSMSKRTAWGYSLLQQTRALRNYIKIGKWRHEVAEKHLFLDEMLPLAISLGVVDQLAKQMDKLGINPPSYMQGMQAGTFANNFSLLNSSLSRNITAAPSGSSSGGFTTSGRSSWSGGSGFSGGSSGGGFGGGGGGSW